MMSTGDVTLITYLIDNATGDGGGDSMFSNLRFGRDVERFYTYSEVELPEPDDERVTRHKIFALKDSAPIEWLWSYSSIDLAALEIAARPHNAKRYSVRNPDMRPCELAIACVIRGAAYREDDQA